MIHFMVYENYTFLVPKYVGTHGFQGRVILSDPLNYFLGKKCSVVNYSNRLITTNIRVHLEPEAENQLSTRTRTK